MEYGPNSRAELRAEVGFQQRQFRPRARDVLVSWTRTRECRDGEARYVELARSTSDPDVRERFVAIARHYRSLAKIEQSSLAAKPSSFRNDRVHVCPAVKTVR